MVPTLVMVFLGFQASATDARAITYQLDIPAQNLNDALQALALASQHKLLYSSELVDGKSAPALKGEYTTEQAVKELLNGTNLSYEVTADGMVLIGVPSAPANASSSVLSTQYPAPSRLAQAESSSSSEKLDEVHTELQEIIVTAQKQGEQRLRDVPIPISVISGDSAIRNNQLKLNDLYSQVPGLSISSGVGGVPALTIRGLSTGKDTNPSVGVVVDDMPYGSALGAAQGAALVEFDPNDLARIEVLRGPQGTLYGASSIGGLLRYVTKDPSPERLAGQVQSNIQSIRNDDGLGYTLRGSVNVPVGDTFAIRASAFGRHDAGFIDDPVRGLSGINDADYFGGRIAAVLRLAENASLKIQAIHQNTQIHAPDNYSRSLPGISKGDFLPGWEGYNSKVSVFGGTLDAKLGAADITSITAYTRQRADARDPLYNFYTDVSNALFGVSGSSIVAERDNKKFSQELRASIPITDRADWLVGAFFTDEDNRVNSLGFSADAATGQLAGQFITFDVATKYREFALFTDATARLTNRFDVQLGVRQSWIEQSQQQTSFGPLYTDFFGIPDPGALPNQSDQNTARTYLLTPRFKPSSNVTIYARVASGYRVGGPNYNIQAPGVPRGYDPDTSWNYEIGFKGDVLNRGLSLDASLYYIDWKNLQVVVGANDGISVYTDNSGRARSKGAELSITARPLDRLTITAWGSYNDAILKELSPSSTVPASVGDRLPYSSRFTGYIAANENFPLSASTTGTVGASFNRIGSRHSEFGVPRPKLPAYHRIDIHVGLQSANGWEVNLFVNNLTDERGLVSIASNQSEDTATIILPRTVGLSIGRDF